MNGYRWMIPILLFAGLASCTEIFVQRDLQDEWCIARSGPVVLHYRPDGYSDSVSPGHEEAQRIAANQNLYAERICDSLKVTFSDTVLIYLFNRDEAEIHIGTSGGGHALPKYNTIYFTHIASGPDLTDQYGIRNPRPGAHELVHVISHRTLGYPQSKLMSEGYANWLDGTFAGYRITDLLIHFAETAPERLLSADQLLDEYDHPDYVYYPNTGVFIGFLANRYGMDKINMLFTLPAPALPGKFTELLQDTWESMAEAYDEYLEKITSSPGR